MGSSWSSVRGQRKNVRVLSLVFSSQFDAILLGPSKSLHRIRTFSCANPSANTSNKIQENSYCNLNMQAQKARMFRSAIRGKLSDSACMQDEETDYIFHLVQESLHVSINLFDWKQIKAADWTLVGLIIC